MNPTHSVIRAAALSLSIAAAVSLQAQAPGNPPLDGRPPAAGGFPQGGPGGFGGPGGPGGPGGMGGPPGQQEIKLLGQFDKNGDKWLNAEERKAARESVVKQRASQPQRGFGRGGQGRGGEQKAAIPGPKMSPSDVKSAGDAPFYDVSTLRTLFFEFENVDWEKELVDFHKTDVEVPAKLTVDGKVYKEVGVHFRGMSSYFMIGDGQKRSLNVSLDLVHKDQNLGGYRTLNLMNAHEDPTFQRGVLFSAIARIYIPAPKANFVRVVINGEYWGVYVSQEQFNKDFTKENFGSTKGSRWKVTGSPNGRGGLVHLGEDVAAYKKIYDLKTKDDPKAWQALIKLTKTLNQTPPNQLEAALAPMLDVDGALKFLALENALINNDGYWIRASDYSIYLDEKGKFHIVPSDMNETFSRPGGPGFGGGGPGGGRRGQGQGGGPNGGPGQGPGQGQPGQAQPQGQPGGQPGGPGNPGGPGFGQGQGQRGGMMGGGNRVDGVKLDPLIDANDANKALLSKMLAVPALKQRYLGYVRDVADKWLDWSKLGPMVEKNFALISDSVKIDTRKLDSTEDFLNTLKEDSSKPAAQPSFGPGGSPIALKTFADQRRAYLLEYKDTTPVAKN